MFNPIKVVKKVVAPITGKVSDAVEKKIFDSIVRKVAVAVATLLVQHGYADASATEAIVGVVIGIASVIAGAVQKQQEK